MFLRSRLKQEVPAPEIAKAVGPTPPEKVEKACSKPPEHEAPKPAPRPVDPFRAIKGVTHRMLIDHMRQQGLNESASLQEIRAAIGDMLEQALVEANRVVTRAEKERLIDEIYHDVRGLGPLEPLLSEDDISEIMVNNPNQVYIERKGKIHLTDVTFYDDKHLLRVIDRIVSRIGRHIDEGSPMCDARLPDGSRVNAIIPPLAIDGPALTIRKFKKDALKDHHLIEIGSLTRPMADFLKGCVTAKLNVLISGGTGSGKTTLLNILSAYIPEEERLITIEDAAELQLQQSHVIRLETRPNNIEGVGGIHQADLLKNCLRMRPDRIILGEVRGGEALAMLQAMNTGHEGSLATVHANTTRDALARLETMVLMAGSELPIRAIRDQIASALDLIIQIERSSDGGRRIVSVTELVGMEGDTIQLQELFTFHRTGIDPEGKVIGAHRATGLWPKCANRLTVKGISLAADLFRGEPS